MTKAGTRLASFQVVIALALGGVAFFIAPDLATAKKHQDFVDFFATSAQVIAALFVALAVEARFLVRRGFLAYATGITIAIGMTSAVTALSPTLDTWMYKWLFAFTVGGGAGGLLAAVVLGVQALRTALDAAVDAENKELERTTTPYEQPR